MKNIFLLFFLILIFPYKGLACALSSPFRHINPDSTEGGLVSSGARVAPTVFVSYDAKVCDTAWVDGNAKVLDKAVIKGNAWIKDFSVVKGNAEVGENAVVWGNQGFPVLIDEDAKIFGSARVLAGSNVTGKARVFGNTVLKSSNVSHLANVCLNATIEKEEISDDYFCNTISTLSKTELLIKNLKTDKFNYKINNIVIESKDDLFQDKRFFNVKINDQEVDHEQIRILGKQIIINGDEFLEEGFNSFQVIGKDYLEKEINFFADNIVLGTLKKEIELSGANKAKAEAYTFIDGEKYNITIQTTETRLVLVGLPNSDLDYDIRLNIISDLGYYSDLISSNNLPFNLDLNPYPDFITNDADFSNGMISWVVNSSESIEEVGNKLEVSFGESELVELSKTFKLSAGDENLSINFKPSDEASLFDDNLEVELIFISPAAKKMHIEQYNFAELDVFRNTLDSLQADYGLTEGKEEKVTIVLRLRNSLEKSSIPQKLYIYRPEVKEASVKFIPMSMSVRNLAKNIYTHSSREIMRKAYYRPPTYLIKREACSSNDFDVSDTSRFEGDVSAMKHLSVGSTPTMPLFRENRIYGELVFDNLSRLDIIDIRLVVVQGGSDVDNPIIIKTNLSTCILDDFERLEPSSPVSFGTKFDLSRSLFSIRNTELFVFDNSEGKKASMYVEADVFSSNGFETIRSKSEILHILKSPDLDDVYTYGEVDDYDSYTHNIVRTGGDKWMLPVYSKMLENIIYRTLHLPLDWVFGDLTKLNGGNFLGHEATHKDGRDADIRFVPKEINDKQLFFNFEQLGSDSFLWEELLSGLESFLSSMNIYYKYIRDIYIEKRGDIAKKNLNIKFANRCFEGRYINFEAGNGQRSLLKNTGNHNDHLHLRFNEVDGRGEAVEYEIDSKPDIAIDAFKFTLKDNYLTVEPRDYNDFKDKYFMARFQSVKGFDDLGMNLQLIPQDSKKQKNNDMQFLKSDQALREHIIITVAKKKTGACVDIRIDIDPVSLKNTSWIYEHSGKSFKLVTVE